MDCASADRTCTNRGLHIAAKKLKYEWHVPTPDPHDTEIIGRRKVSTRVGIRDDGTVYVTNYGKRFSFSNFTGQDAISIWFKLGELFGVDRDTARELLEDRDGR